MLDTQQTALVLIDIQGKLAHLMHDKDRLFHNLRVLIQGCQALDLPIFWMEQYPKGLGPTVPEIADLLTDQTPLAKTCFSACGQEEFAAQLQASRRRQILLAGIETHICVYQTACDLLDQDYTVEVVTDAVSSRTPANHQLGLRKMQQLGARPTSTEMALFELLRIAGTDAFKTIAKLVK